MCAILRARQHTVGHEDSCQSGLVLVADVQQFDSGPVPCQALEGQLHFGETLELNLKSQTLSNASIPLGCCGGIRVCANRIQLLS